jgi:hypothetical protein
VLFNQAVAWLHEQRILLPGASVLARLAAEVRAAAADRLHPDCRLGCPPKRMPRCLRDWTHC